MAVSGGLRSLSLEPLHKLFGLPHTGYQAPSSETRERRRHKPQFLLSPSFGSEILLVKQTNPDTVWESATQGCEYLKVIGDHLAGRLPHLPGLIIALTWWIREELLGFCQLPRMSVSTIHTGTGATTTEWVFRRSELNERWSWTKLHLSCDYHERLLWLDSSGSPKN